MKTLSFWKKPLYSVIVFFGTIIVFSIGYTAWNAAMSSVDGGDSLSSIKWNAFVDNINDLNARVTNLSTSTFQMLGRGASFNFNNLTSNTAGVFWVDGGSPNTNGPIGGGNSVGHLMQFDPLYSSNPDKYRLQISNPQDNYLYWRDQSNGTWKNWRRFISEDPSGNVGIGRGNQVWDEILGIYKPGNINQVGIGIYTTNPSYTKSLVRVQAESPASTSWKLFDGRAMGGAQMFYVDGAGNEYLAGTLTQSSDERLKKDITPIGDSLGKILKLNGVTYSWKDASRSEARQIGVIAQDVEKVFPEAVATNDKGMRSVAYGNLVAPLIEAVKELKKQNDTFKQENIEIRARLEKIEQR